MSSLGVQGGETDETWTYNQIVNWHPIHSNEHAPSQKVAAYFTVLEVKPSTEEKNLPTADGDGVQTSLASRYIYNPRSTQWHINT